MAVLHSMPYLQAAQTQLCKQETNLLHEGIRDDQYLYAVKRVQLPAGSWTVTGSGHPPVHTAASCSCRAHRQRVYLLAPRLPRHNHNRLLQAVLV